MANFHMTVKVFGRSKGQSVIAAAAYRAGKLGEPLLDEETGLISDFSKKSGVISSKIYLPKDAPPEFQNRSKLWNTATRSETRKNSTLAREIEISLPNEVDDKFRERLIEMIAIEIVERFIRRKRRVCYGGQAINALLSKERQFYDERYSVPDYDFFSPTFEEDTDELIEELKNAGFHDVNKKLSVHDGTSKILMNFIPVADCSSFHPTLFKMLQKRAVSVNGILYADPDFLRMNMYVELSRPRGEVDRWRKVFERLTLLNNEYPPTRCSQDIIVSHSEIGRAHV